MIQLLFHQVNKCVVIKLGFVVEPAKFNGLFAWVTQHNAIGLALNAFAEIFKF